MLRLRMEVVGKPDEIPRVQQEVQKVVDGAEGKSWPMISIETLRSSTNAPSKPIGVIETGRAPLLRMLSLFAKASCAGTRT